jgi:predicted dehydrogenase
MQKKVKIGVIGAGHLGKHHIKHLSNHSLVELVGFFDIDKENAASVSQTFNIKNFDNEDDLIDLVEAISIITPTETHYDIAAKCLKKKKDVFIEKPITNTSEQAKAIIKMAASSKNIVQVGHIERFNPTINQLKSVTGSPHCIEIERLAPFQARGTEVPVVLDLMIHDIDLVLSMVNEKIQSIEASGSKMMSKTVDIAHAQIKFINGVVANLKSSRIAQNYVRKIRTYEENLYTITDLMIPQIEVYNLKAALSASHESTSKKIDTSDGIKTIFYDKIIPEEKDALLEEINNFIYSIQTRKNPIVDGPQGLNALEIALEIENKILQNVK